MRRRIVLYLVGIFAVIQLAGKADREHAITASGNEPLSVSEEITDKIEAFKEGGVEKEINANEYDVEGVIDYAKSLVGTPHVMGGYSASGIDCSGLVKLAHAQFDVTLPRSSHDQARYGTIISAGEELRRGDILFFHSTYKKNHLITHTGIYLGDNAFIHTSSKRGVTISKLNSNYYRKHYLFATRLKSKK
jgi:murein DD-endopeptidase / murein LD-carboxypeptidase